MAEEKKNGLSNWASRILLGSAVGLFYGIIVFMNYLDLNMNRGPLPFLITGLMVSATVLTGIRAKLLKRSAAGWAIGSFFSGLIPSVVLLFLGKNPRALIEEKNQARIKETQLKNIEKAILSFAKEHNGVVTISNAALDANITMDEARKLLDELVKKGYADMEIRDSGSIIYVFRDFRPD